MRRQSLVPACLIILSLCLLAAAPSALKAQEKSEPACPLFLQQAPVTSSAETPFLAPESLPAASLVTASTGCGSCSFRGCVGALEGHACVTFAGAAGTCQITGKICGDHSNHCGCY